jgi:hypothetical protein
MAYEKNPDEMGALWAKQGPKGPYLTGEIAGVKVVCFPVKPSERGPAWRVMKSQPREAARVAAPSDDDINF